MARKIHKPEKEQYSVEEILLIEQQLNAQYQIEKRDKSKPNKGKQIRIINRLRNQRRRNKRKQKRGKKQEQEKIEIVERIRKQVVLNGVNRTEGDSGLVFISIRAITINPDIDEKGLMLAINEAKKDFESQAGISWSNYQKSYFGMEKEKLGSREDSRLSDGKVYIEFFYNGRVQKVYKI